MVANAINEVLHRHLPLVGGTGNYFMRLLAACGIKRVPVASLGLGKGARSTLPNTVLHSSAMPCSAMQYKSIIQHNTLDVHVRLCASTTRATYSIDGVSDMFTRMYADVYAIGVLKRGVVHTHTHTLCCL